MSIDVYIERDEVEGLVNVCRPQKNCCNNTGILVEAGNLIFSIDLIVSLPLAASLLNERCVCIPSYAGNEHTLCASFPSLFIMRCY